MDFVDENSIETRSFSKEDSKICFNLEELLVFLVGNEESINFKGEFLLAKKYPSSPTDPKIFLKCLYNKEHLKGDLEILRRSVSYNKNNVEKTVYTIFSGNFPKIEVSSIFETDNNWELKCPDNCESMPMIPEEFRIPDFLRKKRYLKAKALSEGIETELRFYI